MSQDAIRASNQTSDQFWSRIEESFNVAHTPKRTKKSLQNKWTEIKHDSKKFMGCINKVALLKKSGTNANDEYNMVLSMYADNDPKSASFKYEHCWRILKDAPEWALEGRPKPTEGRKAREKGRGKELMNVEASASDIPTSQPTLADLITSLPRPAGSKTSKIVDQLQHAMNENISRNSKLTLKLSEAMDAQTKVIEDLGADELFGKLPSSHLEWIAHMHRRLEEQALLRHIRISKLKRLKAEELERPLRQPRTIILDSQNPSMPPSLSTATSERVAGFPSLPSSIAATLIELEEDGENPDQENRSLNVQGIYDDLFPSY